MTAITAITAFLTAFSAVFLVFYVVGRQDYPGEYRRPIRGAIKPAVIAACVAGLIFWMWG